VAAATGGMVQTSVNNVIDEVKMPFQFACYLLIVIIVGL
jgi:hypothetical protein